MSDGEISGVTLPPEIVDDVLLRLPVKSLCRLKCVSPSWNSLISSPHFAKTHLNRINTANDRPRKAILISDRYGLFSVDFSTRNPTVKKLNFPTSVDRWVHVVGSCNGLLLFSDVGLKSNFLLNPSTRECKKLATFALYTDVDQRGFGYDSSTNDYKVVMISSRLVSKSKFDGDASTMMNVAVYSLKTDAWRNTIHDSHYESLRCMTGIYVNECLHWLCQTNGFGMEYGSYFVAAFNLSDEIFREVELPPSFSNIDILYHQMEVLAGCLCLVVWTSSYRSEVWMMKEYGVRESWTKFSIGSEFDPGFHNGIWMMLAEDEFLLKSKAWGLCEEKFVVCNPKKATRRYVVVGGMPPRFRPGPTYVESLISPNHGGGIVWK